MDQSIERELKMLLTKEQFETLVKAYPGQKVIDQENIYYDDAQDSVKNQNGALRLRKTGDSSILTVKLPYDSISKYEYEKPAISESLTEPSPSDLAFIQSHMNVQIPLKEVVSFTTERHITRFENGELCLDKSDYEGTIDYELEYEYYNAHDGIGFLNELLKPFDIQYEKNCPSKIARAVSYQKHTTEN
jgi:uncharacterized protein YjbK